MNYALQPMSREAFVSMMTADLPPAPRYFPFDAEINRRGAPALPAGVAALSSAEVECARDRGAIVLDVRDSAAFGAQHVPGSINIGLRGQFASWAGTLLEHDREIVIVAADEAAANEAGMRLARVGLENIEGALLGGVDAWRDSGRALASLPQMSVEELRGILPEMQILDVRRRSEYDAGHVPTAVNVPLDFFDEHLQDIDMSKPTALICAGGYRSSAAASLLRRHTTQPLINVTGGTAAWIAAGHEAE
jgi:rhodanese-related sulfurtransferase